MCASYIKNRCGSRKWDFSREIPPLRKACSSPHTGTVALTCVFWVIFGQHKPFNTLWQLRLLILHTHTHTLTQSFSCPSPTTQATDSDSIAEAVTSGQDARRPGRMQLYPHQVLATALPSRSLQAANYVVKITHSAGAFLDECNVELPQCVFMQADTVQGHQNKTVWDVPFDSCF